LNESKKEGRMELFYWIGGVLAAVLLVYLLIALLKPEALS
jgi:K+-transporting ATPase KdpF subunit